MHIKSINKLVERLNTLEAEYGKSLAGNRETAQKINNIRHHLVNVGYISIRENSWRIRPIEEVQGILNDLCRQVDAAERNGDTARGQKENIKQILRISRESFVVFSYDAVINTYNVK